MLLFSLAAFAQAATSPPGPREELMTCAAATLAAPAGDPRVSAGWYVAAAIRADPQPGTFFRRFANLTAEATAQAARYREGGALAARAEAARADCGRRFPAALGAEPARLPADPEDRTILCYSMITFLRMLSRGESADIDPLPARLKEAELTLEGQLPGGQDLVRRADALMVASAEHGNAATISEACAAQPGS